MGCAHDEERPAGVTGRGRRRLFASGNSAPAVHGNRWLTPSGTLHPVGAGNFAHGVRGWGNSPRLMPRQDKSPACAGLGNESARWRGGVFFGEVRRTRFTRHEDRSGERNEELACARSEEWAVAHGEERPAGSKVPEERYTHSDVGGE